MTKKKSATSLISDLKRKPRKSYNSEEKIRIIIDGMHGENSIAELCRKESISQGIYYKWSKDFMEAGKKRMNYLEPRVRGIKTTLIASYESFYIHLLYLDVLNIS